jgi:peptidoglycan/xylan/chitin deacetylase (PgdA/CDA1 family)
MRRALVGALVLVLMVSSVFAGVAVLEAGDTNSPVPVGVTVNGVRVVLPPRLATTEQALTHAGIAPRPGVLRSAVSGTVLDPAHDPAVVLVDGSPAAMYARLPRGSEIVTTDGVDTVESTLTREIVVPYPNQDKVATGRFLPGVEGLVVETYGERSGEVVERRVEREPVPAREIPRPVVVSAGTMVFLTFDDGPDPTYTPQVLDVLRAQGVRATFCLVGRYARARPDLVRRIRDEGHALCNHTESHASLDRLTSAGVEAEIRGGAAAIAAAIGESPALFRLPYGKTSPVVDEVIGRMGLRLLGWNVDPSDYTRPGALAIHSRVIAQVRPGGIVGLHDGGGDRSQTVAALPLMIASLREAGYAFGTP